MSAFRLLDLVSQKETMSAYAATSRHVIVFAIRFLGAVAHWQSLAHTAPSQGKERTAVYRPLAYL